MHHPSIKKSLAKPAYETLNLRTFADCREKLRVMARKNSDDCDIPTLCRPVAKVDHLLNRGYREVLDGRLGGQIVTF